MTRQQQCQQVSNQGRSEFSERSSIDLNLPLDVVVLAFEHVETLERQVPAGQQGSDVVHHHLPAEK